MSWRCAECGYEANKDGSVECEGCGFRPLGPLVLASEETGKEIRVNITTGFGKSLLQSFAGDEAIYASNPLQFTLIRDPEASEWLIAPTFEAKNPTFLDGSALEGEAVVLEKEASHVVSIGPEKMRITVKADGFC